MTQSSTPPPTPTPRPRTTVCPYCGHVSASTSSCERCRGLFEPLSRQASQNSMGPWFIRDEANPFLPGCSLQTLRGMIRRGRISRDTILRGPSTRQFWMLARNTPGIANLLGECHACHADASPADPQCASCGASFAILDDRERLGLSEVRLLPGHSAPEQIAAASGPPTPPAQPLPRSNGVAPPGPAPEHFPHDAQALIASSQRRRRARQRLTIAVVLACIALAAAAGTVAFVLANQDRNPAPKAPSPAPQAGANAAPEPAPSPVETPEPPPPAAPSEEAAQVPAETNSSALIAALTSSDESAAAAALRSLSDQDRAGSPRVRAAAELAEVRLLVRRLGSRL